MFMIGYACDAVVVVVCVVLVEVELPIFGRNFREHDFGELCGQALMGHLHRGPVGVDKLETEDKL